MSRRILFFVCFVISWPSQLVSVEPGEILPRDLQYDPKIPTPSEHLGFKIGERHIYHHELIGYIHRLAASSKRVTIQQYARSHGGRPLVMAFISSPRNHKRLEKIRQRHVKFAIASEAANLDVNSLPAIINMGYAVHGNEASAGNAAALVAYYLAAVQGADHQRLLENTVVLLDPCLNPDGFDRFAHWVNNHRGQVPNADPHHREHREPSPNGRTNYYWFDLNRDWLPVQHPESQGRVAMFHRWKPNVVLDFHEMGTNSTYFFQPGVTARNHPLTPSATLDLTREFAKFHAAALDELGSLYYTEEVFDDFYMGKGSTYPDLHGSIGILFEQASVRGHRQESVNGDLTFAFAIRNQFATSMSSLQATLQHRVKLLEHTRTFYQDAAALARNTKVKAYVVSAPHDPARLFHFLEILARHEIDAFRLATDVQVAGRVFRRGQAYVVPANQPEFRFLQALFERRTEFEDNVFYDVSTWTLPLAFGLAYSEMMETPAAEHLGTGFSPDEFPDTNLELSPDDLAYVIDWRGYYAPKSLYQLLSKDMKVKVASQPFRMQHGGQDTEFGHGTLLVPLGIQPDKRDQIVSILKEASSQGVQIIPAKTGLTTEGIDLGSSNFQVVPRPKVLLACGTGVSSYEAGEVWHLLDRRFEIPVTLADSDRISGIDLWDYTVIALVSGNYSSIPAAGVENLKQFVKDGGTLVAIGTAIRWVNEQQIVPVEFQKLENSDREDPAATPKRRPYAGASRDAAFKLLRGSIFSASVDHTHPIGYGYAETGPLPVFRNNTVFLRQSENAYSTPVVYDEHPLLSGYISAENLKILSASASVVICASGRGRVVLISENPNFRAFWFGTNRLFVNALFFGPLIRVP